MPNMKPRSGQVTDGLERSPARGMLRAVGMGDDDWVKRMKLQVLPFFWPQIWQPM